MPRRKLGQGFDVSALGLGCMGMTWAYGPADPQEAVRTIHRAIDLGVTFLDTAEIYGPYTNEVLVGQAVKDRRDRVEVATKFGFRFEDGKMADTDSSPANVRKVCDEALARLGIGHIDLFYQHRVDPNVPIEETVGALAELVKVGKVLHIGLSEAGAGTIRKAHAVHPITAVQSEYSVWERGVEAEVLPTCRELGIGFVPYSPLGRGFLTGAAKRPDDLPADDSRRNQPRFQGDNFDANRAAVAVVEKIAKAVDATPGQVALAWLLSKGGDIVPIPGTKRVKYLEENAAAAWVIMTKEALAELDGVADAVKGDRYNPAGMKMVGL